MMQFMTSSKQTPRIRLSKLFLSSFHSTINMISLPNIQSAVYTEAIQTVVPVRAVEHLISRSCGPSMAPFASILGQKVAINQMLNLLHDSNGNCCNTESNLVGTEGLNFDPSVTHLRHAFTHPIHSDT